jgi:hypothetical protein
MERLYDLHDESELVAGEMIWTPFAFHAAKLIEKGVFTIPYPFHEYLMREEDPKANKLCAVQKDTYSVEELAELNRNATPLERLLLYVALNCGMGAAELGRLRTKDFLLHHRHEFADRLGFDSTEADSFIRFLRPKTGVSGLRHAS